MHVSVLLLQGILWHESVIEMLLLRMVKFVWTLWKRIGNPPLASRHVLLVQSYPLSGLLYFFEVWQNAYYRPFHAVSAFCLRVVCKKYTTCVPFSIFMELFMFGALISVLLWSFIWCLDLCCITSVSPYLLLLWL